MKQDTKAGVAFVGFLTTVVVLLYVVFAAVLPFPQSADDTKSIDSKAPAAVAVPEKRTAQLLTLSANVSNSQITLKRMQDRLGDKQNGCWVAVLQMLELEASNDLNAYGTVYNQTRAEILSKDQLTWVITPDQKQFVPPPPKSTGQ